jgi:hypothetical protein
MEATQKAETPKPIIFGRHIVGMALFALLNPLVYYHPEPVGWWLSLWLGSVAFSLAFFGLYYLFFTERAKAAWPSRFFMLAWVFLGLTVLGGWIDYKGARSQQANPAKAPFSYEEATRP